METVDNHEEDGFLEAPAPLREARRAMHAGLNTLQVAATAVTTAESRFAMAALEAALQYLKETLLPGCRAEEITIFPAVSSITGVSNACHVMRAQHTTLMRMAGDLAQVADAARAAGDLAEYTKYLQPLLFGLYAFSRAHLESEDEAYLGLLEAVLSHHQAAALAGEFERAFAVSPESVE
ncbi:MAG: hemerythrin domain-containing protein [Dehalococcoidia bacterium]